MLLPMKNQCVVNVPLSYLRYLWVHIVYIISLQVTQVTHFLCLVECSSHCQNKVIALKMLLELENAMRILMNQKVALIKI